MSLQRESGSNGLKHQSIVLDTMKTMYARAGLRAFWPGLTLGLVGVFPYQAMDLGKTRGGGMSGMLTLLFY